jgi:two-component system response regulator FixJ
MSTPNVLVVDDDMAVCRILHRMLSDEQYQVQISQSVVDAVGAIDQKLFDAYVVDYKLTDGTGLDVAERVRSKGSEAPIILISGYDPSAVALRAEKLHIADIIEKPFSRATICNAVKKGLGFLPTTAKEGEAESVSPSSAEPISPGTEEPVGAKKRFPIAALIGVVIFLLLLSGVAFYLVTQHGR